MISNSHNKNRNKDCGTRKKGSITDCKTKLIARKRYMPPYRDGDMPEQQFVAFPVRNLGS